MRKTLDPYCPCGACLYSLDDAPGGYVCRCGQTYSQAERDAVESEPVEPSVLRAEVDRCDRMASEAVTDNERGYWRMFAATYRLELQAQERESERRAA